METLDSTSSSSSRATDLKPENLSLGSSPLSPSVARLWRPAAQRNLRNQWPKLASYRKQWSSFSSAGRSHATALVNAHLSQRYMPMMELGVLSDMPDIRKKACAKLFKQQELQRSSLLSSYKDMVVVVIHMINTSRSMRCFLKGTNRSPLLQFSNCSEDLNDNGDGAGIPVFAFWSISTHEKLAEELIQMFILELSLKRLLVVEFVSIGCEVSHGNRLNWSNELYPDEFDHLRKSNLYSDETHEPVFPRLRERKSDDSAIISDNHSSPEVLQVYLTAWLAEVNIDTYRVDEIFATVGEEMHVGIT
ncbi:Stellacyanin [Quillaja saponaria]|uniref:Stellacyanin n=1 Tax=Quillaja saponaria TaxID=32244 RepID=A0AAD7QBY9_QUISA|nr:Stellacyanin [Quillaja saponaria]